MNKPITYLAAILIFSLCPLCARSSPIPIDGIAAAVNKNVITMSDVFIAMQPVQHQLSRQYSGAELNRELEAAYKRTLNSLIERRLILDEYKRLEEFVIPDNIVDMQIDEILNTRFDNNRVELMRTLEADGLTMQEWRNEIMNRIIVSFMRSRALTGNVAVSPQTMRRKYKSSITNYQAPAKVELRMIIIHRGSTDEEIAVRRRQAEDVRKRLLAGEDFGGLAEEVSEGAKASEGGYWGWLEPSSRRAELAEVLKDMEPGEISEVIESGNSFYIMKVEARRHAALIPFEEIREDIQAELAAERSQEAYDAWIEHLKQKSYIRKY